MEEGVVCSFVTGSSSGAAASSPALHVREASHPSAACWCVGSGKEERGRGVQHTMCVSGEDHNQAVAHAATGLGGKPDKEKKRGGRRERKEEWCWVRTQKPRRKAKGEEGSGRKRRGGGATMEKRVHLTSARMCSSHATMPCCCVRSASMSMSMRGNVMCGISCHHHHDELFVCQCVLQPSLCVCAEGMSVQAAGEGAHTSKRKEERVCV